MRLCKKINPLNWARRTIILATLTFYALTLPAFFLGLSAFAQEPDLQIPAINLTTKTIPTEIQNNTLPTPDHQVAAYTNHKKTFLYAHSTTAFQNLHLLTLGDKITYLNQTYEITTIQTLPTPEIKMPKLLTNFNSGRVYC